MSGTKRPLRVAVFPHRPDAILIVVPEGDTGSLVLPGLPCPFTKFDVANALGKAGVPARVVEEAPGRWTPAMQRMRRDEKAERASRERLIAVTVASMAAASADDIARERGALLTRKLEVDREIADLKAKVGRAKSNVIERGQFMAPADFRRLEERLEKAKVESQAIQAQLSELKRQERERAEREGKTFEQRFYRAAKELLDPEDFEDVCDAARDDEPGEDGAA